MATSSAAVFRSLVQAIRANGSLYASLIGGVHEGFAPEKIEYPMAVMTPVAMPYEDQWGSRMIVTVVDISIISRNVVEASNLDQSTLDTLDGASLTPDGQTSLICTRVADLRLPPDVDEEGQKVYGVGGTYEIWTAQPL